MSESKEEITPYFVHELMDDIGSQIKVGERQFRNNNEDSYLPVLYRGVRLYIQSYKMMMVYGLTPYIRKSDKQLKYCIHFSLKPTNNDIKLFATFFRNMDQWASTYRIHNNHTYWSAIKEGDREDPDTKSDNIIFKVNTTHKKLLMDLTDLDGNVHTLPTAEEFKKICPPKCWVQVIIETNPIWFAGKKFGISYRILKLKVCEIPKKSVEFREG